MQRREGDRRQAQAAGESPASVRGFAGFEFWLASLTSEKKTPHISTVRNNQSLVVAVSPKIIIKQTNTLDGSQVNPPLQNLVVFQTCLHLSFSAGEHHALPKEQLRDGLNEGFYTGNDNTNDGSNKENDNDVDPSRLFQDGGDTRQTAISAFLKPKSSIKAKLANGAEVEGVDVDYVQEVLPSLQEHELEMQKSGQTHVERLALIKAGINPDTMQPFPTSAAPAASAPP